MKYCSSAKDARDTPRKRTHEDTTDAFAASTNICPLMFSVRRPLLLRGEWIVNLEPNANISFSHRREQTSIYAFEGAKSTQHSPSIHGRIHLGHAHLVQDCRAPRRKTKHFSIPITIRVSKPKCVCDTNQNKPTEKPWRVATSGQADEGLCTTAIRYGSNETQRSDRNHTLKGHQRSSKRIISLVSG